MEKIKLETFTIKENNMIAKDVYKMEIEVTCPIREQDGYRAPVIEPGQFVNITIEGKYLKRPISVCDFQGGILTIIYKVVGDGTAILKEKRQGDGIEMLFPLGNGFDLGKPAENIVLIGGGVGVPPMYYLAKELIKKGKTPTAILGFKNKEEAFYKEEFEKLGVKVYIATEDGTLGERGFVTDVLVNIKTDNVYTYTCGPEPMLKAIWESTPNGQFSFEERMGCGFGACMGCSCKTKYGSKRICKEGPVMDGAEIQW